MKAKRYFFNAGLISLSLLSALICWEANTYGYQWEKTFGGSGTDVGYSIQQTTDRGYIIAGETCSSVYLIKTDPYGIQQWTNTFESGHLNYDATGHSVQQTPDGGYIISEGQHRNVFGFFPKGTGAYSYLIKTDADGNKQWEEDIGGKNGASVQQTSDGGYIIADTVDSINISGGEGGEDVYLIKTDPDGVKQWAKNFGGSGTDIGSSTQQTTDGGYIIAGSTYSSGAGERDAYLIKADPDGVKQWTKTFGGADDDYGYSIQQTEDGGYIIAGSTYSSVAGESDVYLIKTDPDGAEQWTKTFGGADDDYGYSIQQTEDGGYIIAGSTQSYGAGGKDVYLIKTGSDGTEQWTKTFGGSYDDTGYSVQQIEDGGYIIAGSTQSYGAGGKDVYLIYYNPDKIEDADGDGMPDGFEITYFGNITRDGTADYDNDGLTDLTEFKKGTNPINSDTDHDGMPDGWEVQYDLEPVVNDTLADSDVDGLTNLDEYQKGTDPTDLDTDDDGIMDGDEVNTYESDPLKGDTDDDAMPDGWEVQYNLNPLVNDSSTDIDSDGLGNYDEYHNSTYPNDADSDDDGLSDYDEVKTYGTDPNNSDSDNDEFSDYDEVETYGTDPLKGDTDDDAMPDGWEIQYSLDPLVNDASSDPDRDGYTNLQEYMEQVDPNNSSATPFPWEVFYPAFTKNK